MWLWGLLFSATATMASTGFPDFDGDGKVGFSDFVVFAGKFGLSEGDDGYDARYDLNRDGAIGFSDFLVFAENFGKEAPSPVVTIPDANLRSAISEALGKAGDAPITVADMKTLTELSAQGEGISDLTGLESAVNLEILDLDLDWTLPRALREEARTISITDLSPLSGLTKLTELSLDNNAITDVSPLSGLTNLKVLSLFNNAITDVSPLSGLTNLRVLSLAANAITDLSPLSGLTNLKNLALHSNRIKDVSPLSGLTSLKVLSLSNNGVYITDVSSLAGLTNLTELDLSFTGVADISMLSGLTNLRQLSISSTYVTDLSPLWRMTHLEGLGLGYMRLGDRGISALARLTRLRRLILWQNAITDLSPLSGLTHLTDLELNTNNVTDLSPLSGLTNLSWLNLRGNNVTDLSPLSGLTNLHWLELAANDISDLAPLVAITGLTYVGVRHNPLNDASVRTHVPALRSQGVRVETDDYSEYIVFAEPKIHNDNVFVLPVEEVRRDLEILDDYAVRFYQQMSDAFDFLIFCVDSRQYTQPFQGAFYYSVSNDVQGIGESAYFNNSYGSAGKLQGAIFMDTYHYDDKDTTFTYSDNGYTTFIAGPTSHELMHRWANRIVDTPGNIRAHWGFSSANGILGGFDIATLEDYGGGRYGAANVNAPPGWNLIAPYGWSGNRKPYSPIELYLAGLIPPEEVPDLWVAEDGAVGDHEARDRVPFVGNRVKTYTIEDFIAKHGPRVPNHTQAQKEFRAAVILLIRNNRANALLLETLSDDVSLFSHAGEDQYKWVNFYEATGGRATIAMDGLSQFQSRAGAKRVVPSSYGTPPPPIVCHGE